VLLIRINSAKKNRRRSRNICIRKAKGGGVAESSSRPRLENTLFDDEERIKGLYSTVAKQRSKSQKRIDPEFVEDAFKRERLCKKKTNIREKGESTVSGKKGVPGNPPNPQKENDASPDEKEEKRGRLERIKSHQKKGSRRQEKKKAGMTPRRTNAWEVR